MNCSKCKQHIPADAAFCIYCATPLGPSQPVAAQEPVTGPTVRLDPAVVPARPRRPRSRGVILNVPTGGPVRGSVVLPAGSIGPSQRTGRKQRRHGDPSGPLFLIGFLLLIMTGTFWPGILALIGVTQFIKANARGRTDRALRHLAKWGGLTLLFVPGMFFPGLILLMIASSFFGRHRYSWNP